MTNKKLTPEDSDLFRSTVGSVLAVKNDKVLPAPVSKPKPYPKPATVNVEGHLINRATVLDIETVGIEDSLSFLNTGLQHSVLKKLRQGFFGLDAEIDLHGLNSDAAKRQLLHFLHYCVEDGCRCVQIVHGKGYRSANQHPVLKNNLNIWLRQHKDVQAFCSASQNNGGTGAVVVLLQLSEKYRYSTKSADD